MEVFIYYSLNSFFAKFTQFKKINILVCSVFFTFSFLNAQELIIPTKRATFGSKLHTNRDVLNHSIKDSNNDIYLIGTTENDITFNDIVVIKLDINFAEIWRKTISFDTNFSYDRIIDSYLDSQDNLILVCKSANSASEEILVFVKLDASGNVLWEIPTSDYTNPIPVNTFIYKSFLDENDILHLAYANRNEPDNANKIEFLEISTGGLIVKDYNANVAFDSLDPNVKIDYYNGYYYMLSMEYLNEAPYYKFTYYKYNDTELVKTHIDVPEEMKGYISNVFSESYTGIIANKEGGLLLVAPGYWNYKGYLLMKLNDDGSIKYINAPDLNKDKYIIGYKIDNNDNLSVVSNDKEADTEDPLVLTMQKYDKDGIVINTVSNQDHLGQVPFLQNDFLGVYTDNNQVLKYDYNFNLISEVQLQPINALFFQPSSMFFINEEIYLGGTNQDIGYEGSDFLSEEDWSFKKLSSISEINSFTFSGSGTSKAYKTKSIQKAENGNYIVAITEKTGPDNLDIGGSRAPELSHILTYSNDLELLDQQTDVNNDIWVDKPDNRWSFTLNDVNYEYQFNSGTYEIKLVKNANELIWSRNWDPSLNPPSGFIIDSEGALVFRTNLYGVHNPALNRITFSNVLSRIELDRNPERMIMLDNNWIFTTNDISVQVYSTDLKLIAETPLETNYNAENYAPMIQKNNKVIVNTNYNQKLEIYNQFGKLEKTYSFEGDLRDRYAFFEGDDLVVLGAIGKYIIREYSWLRASVNKYENFVQDYIGEVSYGDLDGDGVNDFIDQCPNTQQGDIVNEFGCEAFDLSNTNFIVKGLSESCPESNNGQIEITAEKNYNYTAILTQEGTVVSSLSFTDQVSFTDLPTGIYDVCVKVEGYSNFEQCFQILVAELAELFVNSKVDSSGKKLSLQLSGAKEYHITFNGRTFTTTASELELDLVESENKLQISTSKICQGVFEQKIISNSEILVYPNPVLNGKLNVSLGNNQAKTFTAFLFDMSGQQVYSKTFNQNDEVLQIDMEELQNGMYILNLGSKDVVRTIKILKK